MTNKPTFQDYVRKELGLVWVIVAAIGIGLLAGSIGNMMSIPGQVYTFNRTLEKADLYDFYYGEFAKDPKYLNPELLSEEDRQKVVKLTEIIQKHAPGLPTTLLMFILGMGSLLVFFFKIIGALYRKCEEINDQLKKMADSLGDPADHPAK
ncbi:MAG: hypothetical protein Kow00107_09500 [Planctomycetota bacterium]